MPYATLAEFKARLGDAVYDQLTDLAGGTTPDDSVGQALLDAAHGEFNARLARVFTTPVDTADADRAATLNTYVLDIAENRAWIQHPLRAKRPQRVKDAYDAVMNWLKELTPFSLPGATLAATTGTAGTATGKTKQWTDAAIDGIF